MKNQKPKPWQLSVSALQVVMLVGLVTGSMAGAFYLGFSSGQHVGYESALQVTQNTMARLPVPSEELDKTAAEEVTSEVYAKLTGVVDPKDEVHLGKSEERTAANSAEIPDLGAIVTTDTAPLLPNDGSAAGVHDAASVDELLPGSTSGSTTTARAGDLRAPHNKSLSQDSLGQSDTRLQAGELETLGEAEQGGKDTSAQAISSKVKSSESEAAAATKEVEAGIGARIEPGGAPSEGVPTEVTKSQAQVTKLQVAEAEIETAQKNTIASEPTQKSSSEKPRAVSPKQESSVPVKSSVPAGWYVQVAAQKSLDEANKAASSLRRAGFPVLIEAAQVRGEDYYRVVAGPKSQRAGADKLLAQIKSKKVVQGDPFVRAVK